MLAEARQLLASSQAGSAELVLRALVERESGGIEAWLLLADLADMRGDDARARLRPASDSACAGQ